MTTEKQLVEKLIEIHKQLEAEGLMVTAGKKTASELLVSRNVVPVVRCKDCLSGKGAKHKVCPLYRQGLMKDNDFCSKGEREDNGKE